MKFREFYSTFGEGGEVKRKPVRRIVRVETPRWRIAACTACGGAKRLVQEGEVPFICSDCARLATERAARARVREREFRARVEAPPASPAQVAPEPPLPVGRAPLEVDDRPQETSSGADDEAALRFKLLDLDD